MKIGILTFHRAHNYGAVLQCYAMKHVLSQLGHEVNVIDYRQPFIENYYVHYKQLLLSICKLQFRATLNFLRYLSKNRKRTDDFLSFQKSYLNLTKSCDANSIPQNLDVYIIGSDQLWSLSCLGGIKDDVFFGGFKHKKGSKIIAYAISMNKSAISDIGEANIRELIKNFDAMSLRESEYASKLQQITGFPCHTDIDPTLLANSNIWESLINRKWEDRKYILVYMARHTVGLVERASSLARKQNCELITVDMADPQFDVLNFLSLFKFAKCVVTSSFHACVFSLIFHRPLIAVQLHDGNDDRYVNLLKSVNMDQCLCDVDFSLQMPSSLDWGNVEQCLENQRKESLRYLLDNL